MFNNHKQHKGRNSISKTVFFVFLPLLFLLIGHYAQAQDNPFMDEVTALQKRYDTLWDVSKETIVFTGSSSIRMWKDLSARFPGMQLVNTGFGGSQASDLLLYTDALILNFAPKKVFIYEGDNDIAAQKKPKEIIATTQQIMDKIWKVRPDTEIVLISAKPSISRWELKRQYKRLNRKFRKLSKKAPQVSFVDVWKPMLKGNKLKQDLFVKDGLHMNKKGYDIWQSAVAPFLN